MLSGRQLTVVGIALAAVLLCLVCSRVEASLKLITDGNTDDLLKTITLPDGFAIGLYASGMKYVRSLVRSTKTRGLTFAGSFNFQGIATPDTLVSSVYAMYDSDGDNVVDNVYVIANLTGPNGVAYFKGNLFIAQSDKLLIVRDIDSNFQNAPAPQVVLTFINTELVMPIHYWHGWRYMRFGPDGLLYLALGSPCNTPGDPANGTCSCELLFDEKICQSTPACVACLSGLAPGPRQHLGQIITMNPDGSNITMFAQGMRNSLGFDWHPTTGQFWFTENGRDNWDPDHDNRPPDELNVAPTRGLHFGFPFCYGKALVDSQFNSRGNCSGYVGAAYELAPHAAVLGMRFANTKSFPSSYRNGVFIAEHGSWNRRPPVGYRVTFVEFDDNGNPISYKPFAYGWLNTTGPIQPDGEGSTWGRPVDVEFLDDGSMLVSNELRGEVYRIYYAQSNMLWIGLMVGGIALLVIIIVVALATYFDRKRKYALLA